MLRQKEGLVSDKDASHFDAEYFKISIKEIEEFVIQRIRGINVRSETRMKDDIDEVQNEMQEFFDKWQMFVDECEDKNTLYFGKRFMVTPPGSGEKRLLKQYNSAGKDAAIETLTSMRNVDTLVTGSIIVWEE